MAGRKLNLVKFKKAAIDFSTKYLTCFKCFELIDHAKLLVCNHRFCSKCRENGEPCPICQAVEDGSLQPMGELLEIFGALQQSLGIEKKIRQKCFEKMYSNLITEKTNTQERDENQALDKNECQVDPPANSPKTTTIMQSTAVMETAKDFTENANTADTKTVELVQVEAKDEQESIPVTNNRKRAVKRKNTDSEPLSKESNDAVEVGDQSSKRKRKPSPVEKAVVEECEVVESVTKRKPGVSARKGAKGKETTVSPEPTIASTDTPKKAKQSEEDSDGDTETFKKPLKSALKSKRSKEVDETPSSSKKISFSKKEPKSFSDASAKEPEKSSIKNGKDIVLLSSNINEEQLKLLKKFEKKFGCRLVNEYDDLVTHFVTTVDEENLGARTLKYLMALMGHKYLLGFDWVAESLKSGSLQPEETFEMLGTKKQAKETYGAPKVSRTTQPKMFKGFTFYLDGKFATAGFPNKENFKQLVELGGGTVITTPAQLKAGLKDNLEKLHFIIDPNNQRSKFLAHPNHVQGSDLLNKIMELRFE